MSDVLSREAIHTPIDIHEALIGDAEPICEVVARSWLNTYLNPDRGITQQLLRSHQYEQDGSLRTEKLEDMRQRIATSGSERQVFVARKLGEIVGVVAPKIEDNGHRRVGLIHVDASAQGLGIGSNLLDSSLSWHGANDVHLHVAIYNTRAISFYESRGFKIVGNVSEQEYPVFGNGTPFPRYEMVRRWYL